VKVITENPDSNNLKEKVTERIEFEKLLDCRRDLHLPGIKVQTSDASKYLPIVIAIRRMNKDFILLKGEHVYTYVLLYAQRVRVEDL